MTAAQTQMRREVLEIPIAIDRLLQRGTMVEQTAASRGINPDAPRHLQKVTETV